jgi:hypothetical protein
VTVPLKGGADVPHLGRCTTNIVEDRLSEVQLRIFCESTHDIPAAAIILRHAASTREWRTALNASYINYPSPQGTWLSPLHRAQSFFGLNTLDESERDSKRNYRGLIPVRDLPAIPIEITPEIVTGHALVDIDLGEMTLSTWRLTP